MKRIKLMCQMIALLLIIIVSMTGCTPWTIVKDGEVSEETGNLVYFEDTDFDVTAFAEEVWSNQLFDYYGEKQKDINEVIKDITSDVNAAGESYGFGASTEGSTWNFVVHGKGKVLEVNQESQAGLLLVDLEPYDQKTDVSIQIGPIIKGSSIRDTIDTIKLDNFDNQVQFASISKAFNKKILETVLGELDLTTLEGKEIQFLGAFQYSDPSNILITPVKIEVDGGK